MDEKNECQEQCVCTEDCSENQSKSVQKLESLFGADPTKNGSLPVDMFQEIIASMKKEKTESLKTEAKKILEEAINMRAEMKKTEKEFKNQQQKFEKELGKVLSRLEGIVAKV